MKLSIVTTLYQSAPYVDSFYERSRKAAYQLVGDDYEIVFVDDGSPDDSLQKAIQISENDKHVTVIELSRNFGHHKAMMTGLRYSKGELIYLLDSDLEEKPEWLLDFSNCLRAERCDVVFGIQKKRKGKWFERVTGDCFYKLFNLLSGLNLPANIVTARLMTRSYVDALLLHEEREIFLAGLWHITGFNQCQFEVKKEDKGISSYTLLKKIDICVNSITSFSNKPLLGIFYVGIFISFLSALYVTYILMNKLFLSNPLGGWSSVIASIWFLGGLVISSIGVIGIFLSKVFIETKRRPYSIIRKVYVCGD